MRVTTARLVLAYFGDASRYRHAAVHHQVMWRDCTHGVCTKDRELIEQAETEMKGKKR